MTGTSRRAPRRAAPRALAALALAGTAALAPLATPSASALDIATITVPVEFQTGRVLLVRPTRVDVVENGEVRRVVPLSGPLDIGKLPELVKDPRFVSRPARGVVRLSAVLAERPQATMYGTGPSLRRLELVAGAQITGTRSTFRLRRLTVIAVRADGKPLPLGPRRPQIRFAHGSEVELTRVRLDSLGAEGPNGGPALRVNGGGHLRLEGVAVTRAPTGILLEQVEKAELRRTAVSRNSADGIAIKGGGTILLDTVTAARNAGDGVTVRGPVAALSTAGRITLAENRGDGMRLFQLASGSLQGIDSSGNGGPGVSIRESRRVGLSDVVSAGDQAAVSVQASSAVRLAGISTTGGKSGVQIKGSKDVRLDSFRSAGAVDEALSVNGSQVAVSNADVNAVGEGLVIATGSREVAVLDSTVRGSRGAVRISPGAATVQLTRVRAECTDAVAMRSSGSGVVVSDSSITGAVGLDVRGQARLLAGQVQGRTIAVHAGPQSVLQVERSQLTAQGTGISAAETSQVEVRGSKVRGLRAVDGPVEFKGGNVVSPLPIRWIAVGGLSALVLAIALELIRKARERGDAARVAAVPVHVLNRT